MLQSEASVAHETGEARDGGLFAALSVEMYPRLWVVGLLWNLTRWMSLFLGSYLVDRLTGSPFLVQLVGVAFFAPMFLAGALGGVISDRLDRRSTMLAVLLLVIPAALAMALANATDVVAAWMVYPYMLAIGLSIVVEMTSRRSLVYDLVGAPRITNAMALETLAMMVGTVLGTAGGGGLVSLLGIGPAFLMVALAYTLAFVLLLGLPRSAGGTRSAPASRPGVTQELRAAFAYLRRHQTLISVLGVTALMNTFYFSFVPLVPVFADRLGVNAFLTGVLASATALGSILGTVLIARGLPIRRGQVYAMGSLVALLFLGAFAALTWYPLALAALMVAGIGLAGFSTMQSVLVMTTAEDAMRGRAMGLLSMSIGVLPFAMLLLGGCAQLIGTPIAVIGCAAVGLVAMLGWSRLRPESNQIA